MLLNPIPLHIQNANQNRYQETESKILQTKCNWMIIEKGIGDGK